MENLSFVNWVTVCLIFVWSGFVRSGLGFGGAALAMPLMLLIVDNPLLWLPMVASHLLLFSIITIHGRLNEVDWTYLKRSLLILFIPKMAGVFGLLSLPNEILVIIIYGVTLLYGLTYLFNYVFQSKNAFFDNVLLILGGYASGVSLIGAPLMSAVFARHVAIKQLRVTLFVLWIILVTIKMSTLVVFDVDLQIKYTLLFLPLVGIGHWYGLKMHNKMIAGGGVMYKRMMGVALIVICGYGLIDVLILG